MRFDQLTYLELKALQSVQPLVILPTGCTEQQGPHLPVGFDTWFVEQLTNTAAEQVERETQYKILVLPVPPFGPTPEHRNFGSGYIAIQQDIFGGYVQNTLESLITQGFTKLLIWRGCGGHRLDQVIQQLTCVYPKVNIAIPDMPYYNIWCTYGDANVPGGHADSFTTSIALHLWPQFVDTDQIKKPINQPVDWNDPQLDFHQISNTGVIGDPTHASAELGKQLWQAAVNAAAEIMVEALKHP